MSTNCNIVFMDKFNRGEDIIKQCEQNGIIIYRHWDGYPDTKHGVLETVLPILKDFDNNRGLNDVEYASAWLVAKLKEDYLNIGICKHLCRTSEYLYIITPMEIVVYCIYRWDRNIIREVKTIDLDKTFKHRLERGKNGLLRLVR